MKHDRLDSAACDKVTAWVLGSMTTEERSSFDDHLLGCTVCRNEALALRETFVGIETLAPAVTPAAEVRERLMARIRNTPQDRVSSVGPPPVQIWKQWAVESGSTESGVYFQRADEGSWESTGVLGVQVRKLFVDAVNDRATMLVRMAPGASYPSHRHANVEECLVLEGVLNVGELRMRPGDYQRAAGGSAHVVQSTDTGCMLFIVSSLNDEFLSLSSP